MPYKMMVRNMLGSRYPVYIVIAVAVVFHVLTVRSGHQWNGDFALYVAHAKNIASGHAYHDTGYIYNPDTALISPAVYPPVFPVFLSPVYQVFGLNLHAMKVAGILIFAVFLVVFHRYTCERLNSPLSQLAAVAAVAFSPWFWAAKDQVLPDLLFILFVYIAILLMDRLGRIQVPGRRNLLLAAAVSMVVYLAYGTRSLGLLLVPALLCTDFIRCRAIRWPSVMVTVLFVVFYFAQNAYLNADQSYLDSYVDYLDQGEAGNIVGHDAVPDREVSGIDVRQLVQNLRDRLYENLGFYHQAMSAYWRNTASVTVENVLYVAMGLLAIIGFVNLALRKPSSGDVYLLGYVAVLMIVPFLQGRYLLPLIPLYMVYIFSGVENVRAWPGSSRERGLSIGRVLVAVVMASIFLSYVWTYSSLDFGDLKNGVEKQESVDMFAYIRENTPDDSVLVFRKPRELALYTGRRSMLYDFDRRPDEFRDYFARFGATHFVVSSKSAGMHEEKSFLDWVDSYAKTSEPVYQNNDFRVFRLSAPDV